MSTKTKGSEIAIFETISQVSFHISCKFRIIFLSLQHRSVILRDEQAVLSYEEDVFQRLSLCILNFANSKPQQTDDNGASVWCVSIYFIIYSSYWRGLLHCLSCVARQCEGPRCQDGQKNRHLRLFCIISKPKTIYINLPIGVSG